MKLKDFYKHGWNCFPPNSIDFDIAQFIYMKSKPVDFSEINKCFSQVKIIYTDVVLDEFIDDLKHED
jgi:hypothetical protein